MRRPLLLLVLALGSAAANAAQPLTLDSAIAEAQAHAPAAARAAADLDAAGARALQAQSAQRPSLTLAGSAGAGRLDPGGFFGLDSATVEPRSAQAIVEQPLFAGGRIAAGIDGARAGRRAAEAARDAVRAELAAQVAEAFGAVLVAEEQRRLYAALAATTGELARQADLRFRAGEAPRTDASQAGSRHAEARARLAAAEGQVRVARARLSHLVGHDPGELAPLPPPPDVPATLEAAVADAQAASPRLAEAAAAVDAAVAAESGARADRRPTIGAVAEASAVRDQFFPDYRADSLSVALRAQWRLFDGGRARGRLAEASAAVRGARAQLEAARHDVIEAVTTAYAAFESNTLVEQAAAEQRAAALEAVRNVRAEVKVGQKPQIDLLDAEREATAAGVLLLKAQADRLAAACRLKALTGGY